MYVNVSSWHCVSASFRWEDNEYYYLKRAEWERLIYDFLLNGEYLIS